jgi:hypothetical protein
MPQQRFLFGPCPSDRTQDKVTSRVALSMAVKALPSTLAFGA